jgi:hypothetical protein
MLKASPRQGRLGFIKKSVMQFSAVVKILLLALVFFWLYFLFFVHEPSAKSSTGLSFRGSAFPSNFARNPLNVLADAHARGEDVHALNMEHEEIAVGGRRKPFNQHFDSDFHTDHLIVVAGHAVVHMDQLAVADTQDSAWWLLKYQQEQNFPDVISAHIKRGLELLVADPKSLLVFSGGQTRRDVGPISEAASYYYVADTKGWIPAQLDPSDAPKSSETNVTHREPRERIFLEEYVLCTAAFTGFAMPTT